MNEDTLYTSILNSDMYTFSITVDKFLVHTFAIHSFFLW